MKKYKLLKDLPDTKAGAMFIMSESQNFYYCYVVDAEITQRVGDYEYNKDFVEKTPEWFEEMKENVEQPQAKEARCITFSPFIDNEPEYSITQNENYIKIFIDGTLHIQIPYSTKNSIQSYKEYKKGSNWYKIEFINPCGNQLILAEYDSREKWESVLKLWNENVK